ncbi:hypothetical protein MASR1M45_22980 [Candidatus Kapaibacterium sp.]
MKLIMKKITFITFFFAIFTANSFSETESRWQIIDSIQVFWLGSYYAESDFVKTQITKNDEIFVLSNLSYRAPCIAKSSDMGNSWKILFHEQISSIGTDNFSPSKANDFCFIDSSFAVIVCDSGYYYISRDNGEKWKKNRFENNHRSWLVSFWDKDKGIVFQYDINKPQTILKTVNSGKFWYEISGPKKVRGNGVSYLYTIGNGICYAIEIDNKVDSVYYFHKSTDYGETWQEPYPGPKIPPFGNFYFIDENYGFNFGGQQLNYTAKGKLIRRTSDGGHAWERVLEANMNNDEITDVHFSDSLNGIAASITNIFRTSDGGKTWAEDTTYNYKRDPRISLIYMIDKDNVIGLSTNSNNKVMRFTYKDPTFVVDNYKVTQFQIFPNPATSKININISDESIADHEYSIFDIKGRLVKKGILNKSIDVEELNTGTYYLIISEGDIIYYSKFVKE